MTKVFISYTKDGGAGESLAVDMQQMLQREKFDVFRDDIGLERGDVWESKLEFELTASSVVVLIVSEKTRTSKWTHSEVSMAMDFGVPVIPVLAEAVRTPLWLRHLQAVDFSTYADWGGLVEAINSHIASRSVERIVQSSLEFRGATNERQDFDSVCEVGSSYMHIPERMERSLNAFISYSHKDKKLKEDFFDHLSPLVRDEKLTLWNDSAIDLGAHWYQDIINSLDKADLVICLVSSSFLASNFCYLEEFTKALEDHKKGLKKIIPIRLRPCFWEPLAISKIQSAPSQWITSSENQDEAWTDVVMKISEYIESENARKKRQYEEKISAS